MYIERKPAINLGNIKLDAPVHRAKFKKNSCQNEELQFKSKSCFDNSKIVFDYKKQKCKRISEIPHYDKNVTIVLGQSKGQDNYFRAFVNTISVPSPNRSRIDTLLPHRAKKSVRIYSDAPMVLLSSEKRYPNKFVEKQVVNHRNKNRISGPEIAPNMAEMNEFELSDNTNLNPLTETYNTLEFEEINSQSDEKLFQDDNDTFQSNNYTETTRSTKIPSPIAIANTPLKSISSINLAQKQNQQQIEETVFSQNKSHKNQHATEGITANSTSEYYSGISNATSELNLVEANQVNRLDGTDIDFPYVKLDYQHLPSESNLLAFQPEKKHQKESNLKKLTSSNYLDRSSKNQPIKMTTEQDIDLNIIKYIPSTNHSKNIARNIMKSGPTAINFNETSFLPSEVRNSTKVKSSKTLQHLGHKYQKHSSLLRDFLSNTDQIPFSLDYINSVSLLNPVLKSKLLRKIDPLFVEETISTILFGESIHNVFPNLNEQSLEYIQKIFDEFQVESVTRKVFVIFAALAEKLSTLKNKVSVAFEYFDFNDIANEIRKLKVIAY
ncbi:hypothetical protein HDV01_005980 [Terramyces sp. JEL0728]|nr:hypothetical protein HDV01_005980 [Terramyces sp. JEL0728]